MSVSIAGTLYFILRFQSTELIMSNLKLLGQVAVVTGGAGGIGRAICSLFAREGANVCIVDIDQDGMTETLNSLSRDHGNKHCMVEADVSKLSNVKRIFLEIDQGFGKKATILINNAGVDGKIAMTGSLEENEIDKILNINLKGSIMMADQFVKELKNSNKKLQGCLVNISSSVAKTGAPYMSVYSASKAGMIGLTKSIAQEYPFSDVRCNAILPAFIETPLLANVQRLMGSFESIISTIPLKRVGKPNEIADACLYLVSDQSSYVNGTSLEVNGGFRC